MPDTTRSGLRLSFLIAATRAGPSRATRTCSTATRGSQRPTALAICRGDKPAPHFRRSTSSTFRMDNLFAGICPFPQWKRARIPVSYPASGGSNGCPEAICQGGSFALESVAAFVWNGWQACSGISGSFGVEYATMYTPVQRHISFLRNPSDLLAVQRFFTHIKLDTATGTCQMGDRTCDK